MCYNFLFEKLSCSWSSDNIDTSLVKETEFKSNSVQVKLFCFFSVVYQQNMWIIWIFKFFVVQQLKSHWQLQNYVNLWSPFLHSISIPLKLLQLIFFNFIMLCKSPWFYLSFFIFIRNSAAKNIKRNPKTKGFEKKLYMVSVLRNKIKKMWFTKLSTNSFIFFIECK